jgi:phage shock protein E
MNWTIVFIVVVVLAVYLALKRSGQISSKDARARLKNGAMLIDVRTVGEFASGHLPNAINLPLDEIESTVPRRVRNKDQALLLHCQSGMRSGVARKKLIALGYANVFNLGSYERAAKVLSGR